MNRAFVIAAVCLAATPVLADPVIIGIAHIVSNADAPPPPVDMTWTIQSLTGDQLSVTIADIGPTDVCEVTIPVNPGCLHSWSITDSNAAQYGVDWNAWKSAIYSWGSGSHIGGALSHFSGALTFGSLVDHRDDMCCGFFGHFNLEEIQLKVSDYHPSVFPGNTFAGFSAIAFGEDEAVIPEPASWLLLTIAGVATLAARRR